MSLVELGEPRTAAEMRDRYRAAHHRLYHTRPRPKVVPIHDHTPASQPLSVVVVPRLAVVRTEEAAIVREPVTLVPRGPRPITVAWILQVVSKAYRVSIVDINSERRTRNVMRPRHVAIYLARMLTPHSYPRIAKMFGNRDHTTAMHAVRVLQKRMNDDPDICQEVIEIGMILTAGEPW